MSRRRFPLETHPLRTVALLATALLTTAAIAASAWSAGADAWMLRWTSPDLYRSLARRGFVRADVDGDGVDEVVTTTDGWTILKHVGGFESYRFDYISQRYVDGVAALGLLPSQGEHPQRILVAIGSGQLLVYRASDQALLAQAPLAVANPRQILTGDADNDGQEDLVVLGYGATALLDPDTYELRRTLDRGGDHLAIGNVDDDAAVELVYPGGLVIEQDLDEEAVEWDSGIPFRNALLADVDGDGNCEILRTDFFPTLTALDVETKSAVWTAGNLSAAGDPFHLFDVTGDGTPEIVVSTGSRFFAVTLAGEELWTWYHARRDPNDFAIFDSDDDGDLDVVGAGDEGVEIFDLGARELEWSRELAGGPYRAVDVGDVDGDGELELVAGWLDVRTYDAESLALESDSGVEPYRGTPLGYIGGVKIADQDGDGSPEILVAGSYSNLGAIYVVDAREHAVRHFWLFNESKAVGALAFGDVDADGSPEIVAADLDRSRDESSFVYVIDPVDGSVKWKSGNFDDATRVVGLDIANVDDDEAPEIVVSAGHVHVIDGISRDQWRTESGEYAGISLPLRTKLGRSAIVAGTGDGHVAWIDGVSRRERFFDTGCGSVVPGVLSDRWRRAFFTCRGRLAYYHRPSRSTLWKTLTTTDFELGLDDSLVGWESASGRRIAAGGDFLLNVFAQP